MKWPNTLELIPRPAPYKVLGPWRNHWGYVVTVAEIDGDLIVVKYQDPHGDTHYAYFTDWEECERFVLLLEQDRRF